MIFAANNSEYEVEYELYGELAEVEIPTDDKSRIKDGKYLHDFRTGMLHSHSSIKSLASLGNTTLRPRRNA